MKTKQPLTVGLVLDDTLDTPDGVQQYVLTIGRWLSSQGHEVHYLVGETIRTDMPNVHSLARNVQVRFNGNRLSIPLPARKKAIANLLATIQFDILHIQVPYSPMMAGQVIRLANPQTAVIGSFHVLPYDRWVSIANRGLAIINKSTGKRFDCMVANGVPTAQFARQVYNYTPCVIPNPFPLPDFLKKQHSKRETTTIVFLGRLVERKGALQLLRAVTMVRSLQLSSQPFRVIIGGKGPQRAELERFIASERLGGMVQLAGFVNETDKADFLAQADIAVFPSISGESFGISLLEAMAAARGVVVAGDNPGYRAVMGSIAEGRLVNPCDVAAFAAMLAEWLNNPAIRSSARKQQQAYVKQFDIAVVGKALVKSYTEALRERRNMR